MMNPKYRRSVNLKSRIAGFFAFLLFGCQPAINSDNELLQQAQHDPAAASRLAAKRLAANELQSALKWFRQAAVLGDARSLQHALQLQQRQQGKLETARWLEQQLQQGLIPEAWISAVQRSELGLWQQPWQRIGEVYVADQGCSITLQPVVSQQAGVNTWQILKQQWQQDPQLSQLSVCFNAAIAVNSTVLNCSENSGSLVQCDYPVLNELVANAGFSQLLLVAGRGKASYNNGILQLPDNADLALLQHEFMHILGFIDEYQLTASAAADVCHSKVTYPNLLLNQTIDDYLQQWQLQRSDIQLTPVDSCKMAGKQAYRVVAEANVMRSYELALPALYFRLAKQVLAKPEQIMPVQYYFAYLARQRQDWPQWQQFMQQASAMGYEDAQQALAP